MAEEIKKTRSIDDKNKSCLNCGNRHPKLKKCGLTGKRTKKTCDKWCPDLTIMFDGI